MRSKTILLALALALLAAFGPPARAADITYATGPGSAVLGWYLPALAVPAGTTITFLNADPAQHNFVAKDSYGPDDPRWCYFDPVLGRRTYPEGQCPLFWSQLDGLGSIHEVLGLENVVAGETYTFICTVHVAMKGTLVILPA